MRRSKYVWGILGVIVLIALFNLFSAPPSRIPSQQLPYSSFLDQLEKDQVASVRLAGKTITGRFKNGKSFTTFIPSVDLAVPAIVSKRIALTVTAAEDDLPSLLGVIISWLPFFLYILAFWWFVGRPLARIEQRLQSLESSISTATKND